MLLLQMRNDTKQCASHLQVEWKVDDVPQVVVAADAGLVKHAVHVHLDGLHSIATSVINS